MSTFWQNRRHAAIRALLSSYMDGEVSAAESRRVEEHLTGCDECAAELESLRATMTLLNRMPMLETPRSYALTPADAEAAAPQRRLPSLAVFTGGLATAGAAALVFVLIVGVVFLARLGFMGSAAAPVPAAAPAPQAAAPAAPAAPAPQRVMPAARQPAAAAPAQAPAAPAAQSAPAAAMTMADEEPSPTVAPAPAAHAVPAVAPAPRAAQEGEEITEKEVVMEVTAIDDADAEATAETYTAAQATYEADIAEAQAAATASAQEQVQYATALAQWEEDQEERAREQAEERIATQATYEAQLADSYAEAMAQTQKDAARAAGQVESAAEIQATDTLEQGELTIPLWVLWIVGAAALMAAIAIAVWLVRRRNED